MLKLKNIKKNNDIISAEYDPEDSGDLGNIFFDIKSGEIIKVHISKMDNSFPIYLNHAIDALKKMANKEEIPSEKIVMWY